MDGVDTLNTLESTVSGVNSAYKLFMTSLVGEFHRVTGSNVTKLTLREFTKSCRSLQRHSLGVINHALNDGLSHIESLLKNTDAKDFAAIKFDIAKVLTGAYQNQMSLDIESARSDVFRYMLTVIRQTDKGITQTSALIAANKSVRFNFIDRAGKKWSSERYVTTTTRFEIIKGIYFSYLLGAEAKGATGLKLINGEIVGINDLDRYSHPNSKLIPIQTVT